MPAYPYPLTLTNPGGETGDTSGWTNISGTLANIASGGGTLPRSGSRFFRSGASASTQCRQDPEIALPAEVLADVDAGLLYAHLATPQSGYEYDSDTGQPRIQFLDEFGVQIGVNQNGLVASVYGRVWVNNYVLAAIPANTRTIRVVLLGVRASGTNLDAYWDDIALRLYNAALPPAVTVSENFAGVSTTESATPPTGFVEIWDVSNQLYKGVDRVDSVSGRTLQLKSDGSAERIGLWWKPVPHSPFWNHRTFEMFLRQRLQGSNPRVGLAMVAGGTNAGQDGYVLRRNNDDLVLEELNNGTSAIRDTEVGVFAGWAADDRYNSVFKREGNDLKGKAWKITDDEPVGWQVTFTDATYPITAWGVSRQTGAAGTVDGELEYIAVGFDGVDAPRPVDRQAVSSATMPRSGSAELIALSGVGSLAVMPRGGSGTFAGTPQLDMCEETPGLESWGYLRAYMEPDYSTTDYAWSCIVSSGSDLLHAKKLNKRNRSGAMLLKYLPREGGAVDPSAVAMPRATSQRVSGAVGIGQSGIAFYPWNYNEFTEYGLVALASTDQGGTYGVSAAIEVFSITDVLPSPPDDDICDKNCVACCPTYAGRVDAARLVVTIRQPGVIKAKKLFASVPTDAQIFARRVGDLPYGWSCPTIDCGAIFFNGISLELEVTQRLDLDPTGVTYDIYAALDSVYIIDERVVLTNPIPCGYGGFYIDSTYNGDGYFTALTVENLDACIGSEDPPDVEEEVIEQRRTMEEAWAFVLDGHVFYVLNLTLESALIYDLVAQQWYRWYGHDGFWNMFRGVMWKGRVIAADIDAPTIWELDPHSALDEEVYPINHAVTGFQPLRGSASIRQGAVRVTARKEDVAEPSTLLVRFSDDGGKTWSADHATILAASSYTQRLELRSLGRIRAPGRIWEVEDFGGFVRIEGADADLDGAS